MLFRETIAVNCENPYGTHRYTLWAECSIYKNSVRTSQETDYISDTETNLLMLFMETVAVYCENYTEDTNTLCGQMAEIFFFFVKAGGTYEGVDKSLSS
jgi:hypothetical protein